MDKYLPVDIITCIRVGYGTVAKIHELIFQELNVKTIAVVDKNIDKQKQAKSKGYLVFTSCEEAVYLQPFFWDICVDTDQHLPVIKEIISKIPNANILVEKPICSFSQIPDLKKVLKNFQGKLTIKENYTASQICNLVKEIVWQKLNIVPKRITVEFTKNRLLDNKQGRFIDKELGVVGYEGSHMWEIACQITQEKEQNLEIVDRYFSGLSDTGESIDIKVIVNDKFQIELYTSMTGKIKYKMPVFYRNDILAEDRTSKYRLVAVYGNDKLNNEYTVVGWFEPIEGFNRGQGAIVIMKNGKVVKIMAPIVDNSMANHFQRVINYFTEKSPNPYPVERGIEIVEVLQKLINN